MKESNPSVEILPAHAPPLPAMPPSLYARQAPASRPAGLWMAFGLILAYFVLQGLSSVIFGLVVGLGGSLIHGPLSMAKIHLLMQRPAIVASMVIFTLGVSAAAIIVVIRRKWPGLWSVAQPPGLAFVAPRRWGWFGVALMVGVAAPIMGSWVTEILSQGHNLTQDISQIGAATPLVLRLVLVAAVISIGPIVEELLFRGVLLSALLQKCRAGWAITISAAVFALVHLPGLEYQWFGLPDLLLLAWALAWLRLRSGSIWPSVAAHALNNLLAAAAWFSFFRPHG
jgi:hypothetical protein